MAFLGAKRERDWREGADADSIARLVDDDGNDVGPGEPGEALIKGPIVTQGYHKNPEANAASFTPDGWLRTGDVLRMDGGNLYVVDRKKVGSPLNTRDATAQTILTRERMSRNSSSTRASKSHLPSSRVLSPRTLRS